MNLWRCWENWASQHTANDRRVTFIGLTSGRPPLAWQMIKLRGHGLFPAVSHSIGRSVKLSLPPQTSHMAAIEFGSNTH
jgi:hypothetical protein